MSFSPTSRAQLTEWLSSRDKRPLILHGTRVREEEGEQLIMEGLCNIPLYEPDEMIVQCEAGVKLSDLNLLLLHNKQWIPSLQSDEDDATTVGGALSMDLYHPRARSTQSLRTTVLGGTFATSAGYLFSSGSRVVKSVAGYDTHRSLVGARGKLAIILQVTLRVLPLPESIIHCLAPIGAAPFIRRRSPLVFERYEDKLLIELAGFFEDIEEDQKYLIQNGVELQILSKQEWSDKIKQVRNDYAIRTDPPGKGVEFSMKLKRALDASGVLQ